VDRTTPPAPQRPGRGLIAAAVVLMLGVGAIIGVAFRGSLGSLRDAALACHFSRSTASTYPWGVDGLLIIAIIAGVLLRHDRGARRYCLGIVGVYTGASWLINYLHGLGMFLPDPVTHKVPGPPWPVVLVITSLVIGSIFLGSHLLVFVFRRVFPNAGAPGPVAEAYQFAPEPVRDVPDVPELPPHGVAAAELAYRQSLHPLMKTLSQVDLVNRYGITKREAAAVQTKVKAELAEPGAVEDLADWLDEPSQNGQGSA
jgi:hypothetical protein